MLIPRAHLFGNPAKVAGRISPDGRRFAWLAPVAGVLNVWVGPTRAPGDARPVTNETNRGIHSYEWAYDGRHLLYLQDTDGDEDFHLHAVDLDTGIARDLTPFPHVQARIEAISRQVRDRILVSLNQRDRRFHDLFTIDFSRGELTLVEENHGVARFLADARYRVRLAGRVQPDGGTEILRKRADGSWETWTTFSAEDAKTTGVSHVDANGDVAFVWDARGRNTAAVTRVDLETRRTVVLAAHERADIGPTLDDLETRDPLAYQVTVERCQYVALDPRVQADLDFLDQANIGDWAVGSRTEDDRLWTVAGFSDLQPGVTFLYDRSARSLVELYRPRPALAGAPLVRMHPLTIRSRDGFDLVSYLSLPAGADRGRAGTPDAAQPMVLLVHGGPWGRDAFGFHPWHQWLANRGYAALSVNFRGSTGFGKAFVNAGDREWGRKMDDDLLDAVDWAISAGVADAKRVAIMGGSYGGYATLVGLTRSPHVYACGIDIVGPSNLETLLRDIPPYLETIRGRLEKALGDPTTPEGLALLRERSPLFQAAKIRKPLLIAQGANDPRVKITESEQMVAAMKKSGVPVTYVMFPDEGHGFARPENATAFFAVAESFLARHLGGAADPATPEEAAGTSMKIGEGREGIDWPVAAG